MGRGPPGLGDPRRKRPSSFLSVHGLGAGRMAGALAGATARCWART